MAVLPDNIEAYRAEYPAASDRLLRAYMAEDVVWRKQEAEDERRRKAWIAKNKHWIWCAKCWSCYDLEAMECEDPIEDGPYCVDQKDADGNPKITRCEQFEDYRKWFDECGRESELTGYEKGEGLEGE